MKTKNIKEYIFEKGSASKGLLVSMPLIQEMEVYGFVVVDMPHFKAARISEYFNCSDDLYMPFGRVGVCGDRLVIPMEEKNKPKCYRIFYNAELYDDGKDNVFPIENLYIPRLLYATEKSIRDGYQAAMGNRPYGYKKAIEVPNIELIDDKYFYKLNDDDVVFSSNSSVRGIGNTFLVVCRRLNKVTGELIYELHSHEDVYPR